MADLAVVCHDCIQLRHKNLYLTDLDIVLPKLSQLVQKVATCLLPESLDSTSKWPLISIQKIGRPAKRSP